MIAVIFEVTPTSRGRQTYFDIAAQLRPLLTEIDGFISIERFQSLSNPDKILSLSFFQNMTAVDQWKQHHKHLAAQEKGKAELFQNYHIRVAEVTRNRIFPDV